MQPAADPQHWSQLSAQLDALLELPVDERAAWLEALRADDLPAVVEAHGLGRASRQRAEVGDRVGRRRTGDSGPGERRGTRR